MFPSADQSGSSPRASADLSGDQFPRSRLRAFVRRRDHAVIVDFRGEADGFTLPVWLDHLRAAAGTAEHTGAALVVDTTRLGFLSWRALSALAEEAGRLPGTELLLVSDSATVARMAKAGVGDRVPIHRTVLDALSVARSHHHRRRAAARSAPVDGPLARTDRSPAVRPNTLPIHAVIGHR